MNDDGVAEAGGGGTHVHADDSLGSPAKFRAVDGKVALGEAEDHVLGLARPQIHFLEALQDDLGLAQLRSELHVGLWHLCASSVPDVGHSDLDASDASAIQLHLLGRADRELREGEAVPEGVRCLEHAIAVGCEEALCVIHREVIGGRDDVILGGRKHCRQLAAGRVVPEQETSPSAACAFATQEEIRDCLHVRLVAPGRQDRPWSLHEHDRGLAQ
mmetsp:Transcript_22125/g.51661  ORF Transcript_22125/g.51661 Transcript_22125/m.51661 type:complete len:216 (-) Transcript_22125:1575-2222(-)